jgi:hypothetical protein
MTLCFIEKSQPVVDVIVEEKFCGMPIKNMTKLEVVKELVQHDHSFLTPEAVKEFCKPFGFDPKEFLYKAQDQRSQFKGLYVPAGKEGDWWEGADADQLAAGFCHKLGVKYWEMYGRGSRLRECCRALIEFLSK